MGAQAFHPGGCRQAAGSVESHGEPWKPVAAAVTDLGRVVVCGAIMDLVPTTLDSLPGTKKKARHKARRADSSDCNPYRYLVAFLTQRGVAPVRCATYVATSTIQRTIELPVGSGQQYLAGKAQGVKKGRVLFPFLLCLQRTLFRRRDTSFFGAYK